MLFPQFPAQPDDSCSLAASGIGQQLPQMAMVGGSQLVFNYHLAPAARLLGLDIDHVAAHTHFPLSFRLVQLNAERFAQSVEVLKQPWREVMFLMLPEGGGVLFAQVGDGLADGHVYLLAGK